MTRPASEPAWLNGWRRSPEGWLLEAVVPESAGWMTRLLPATWLFETRRLFEPSARPFARLPSRSIRLRIPDVSQLSPLLDPGALVVNMIPPARPTPHAVYVVAHEEGWVYLPAALLLTELWAWTAGSIEALLTPNSLALCLSSTHTPEGLHVQASGLLARVGTGDTSLRRLSWLAQCTDAQASWSSVLTFAHDGALQVRLPRASLDAWAWGVELPTGILVAELSAVFLSFELPQQDCRVTVGMTSYRCPPPPSRRAGLVTF